MDVLLADLLVLLDGGAVPRHDAVLVRLCHAGLKRRKKENILVKHNLCRRLIQALFFKSCDKIRMK